MLWVEVIPSCPSKASDCSWRCWFGRKASQFPEDPYKGFTKHFLSWWWYQHAPLRLKIYYDKIQDAEPDEPANIFVTSLPIIHAAETAEDQDAQIEALLKRSRFHTTMGDENAQKRAAGAVLNSTRYTRELLMAETANERNLLLVPVRVGKHVLGGSAIFSERIIPDPVSSALVLAIHTLLYRIRLSEMKSYFGDGVHDIKD
ncbi:hypothetical protein ES703_113676 [subsurface metagenome]